MTKKEATDTARDESTMYAQGTGWIVSIWSPIAQAWMTGHERPYRSAMDLLQDYRRERVAELMG